MKYDFTTVLDRRGKDSIAADLIPFPDAAPDPGFDRIPMWVADMNFPTAPPVLEAVERRLRVPGFGYFSLSDEYYDAIIRWHRMRNNVSGLTREAIGYENGVLGGVSSAVCSLTAPGERILLHSPCYIGFIHTLEDIGRSIVYSPLVRDENGIWRMDYEDMDRKLRENGIRVAVFCTPHNPTGRVWELWELQKAMEVYAANGCTVISDEIWSDIVLYGNRHIPLQSVSSDAKDRVIALYSPTKTFSLSGMLTSYHIIYNEQLRDLVRRTAGATGYNHCNVLSQHALVGAYSDAGAQWADEMRSVIESNLSYACDLIAREFPGVRTMRPQGTYMLFLDCGDWCREHRITIRELQLRGVRCGVIWQDGEPFMFPDSIRMNFALPHSMCVEAMDRLKRYVFVP